MFCEQNNLPNVEELWPLITKLSKAKAIKQSHDSQNHKNKKAFKFNYVLISQNTKSWKTSLVRISILVIKLGSKYFCVDFLKFYGVFFHATLYGCQFVVMMSSDESIFCQ